MLQRSGRWAREEPLGAAGRATWGGAAPRVGGSARLCGWEPPPALFRVNTREATRSLQAPVRRHSPAGPADSGLAPSAECTNTPRAAAGGRSHQANHRQRPLTSAAGRPLGPREKDVPGHFCLPHLSRLLRFLCRISCLVQNLSRAPVNGPSCVLQKDAVSRRG